MIRAVEATVWWAVLVGVWLTTLNTIDLQDLALAAATAVPCALIAIIVRRAYGGHWGPVSAWTLPAEVARGSAALFSQHKTLRHIPVRPAQKAVKTVLVSASPGTVVLDDGGGDALLVHALGGQ